VLSRIVEVVVADLLAAGATWLSGQLKQAAGRAVTYSRNGNDATITATIGRSQFESQNQSGVIENWESRDYLLPAGDLPFGEPRRGDQLLEEINGELLVFEVSAPRGVPVFHFGDAFRSIVRIHTKAIEAGVTFLSTETGETLTTEAGETLAI
jgi:hypothetical protein